MTNSLTAGLRPTHPGEILREDILPALKEANPAHTKVKIAELLGISRQLLYDLLNEKTPITPAIALRIGKLMGTTPEMWLNLQHSYDLRLAEAELRPRLAKIPTIRAA